MAAHTRSSSWLALALAGVVLVSSPRVIAAPGEHESPSDAAPVESPSDAAVPAEREVAVEPEVDVEPEPPPVPAAEREVLDSPIDIDTDTDEDFDDELDEDVDEDVIDDDYNRLIDSSEARTARRWLSAGIGATITGSVLVGGAIAMSQTAPCDPLAGNNCFADARDRGAASMGIPGGVLLVGGIAMTIVGALQRRRLWYGVAVVPTGTGLAITGRF